MKFSHSLSGHEYSVFKSVFRCTNYVSKFWAFPCWSELTGTISKSVEQNIDCFLYKMQFLPCQVHCKSTGGAVVNVQTGRQLVVFNPHFTSTAIYVQMRWAETIYVNEHFAKFCEALSVQDDVLPGVLCSIYLCLCFIFVTGINMTAVSYFDAGISPWNLSIIPNWCHVIFMVDKVALEQSPPPSSFFSFSPSYNLCALAPFSLLLPLRAAITLTRHHMIISWVEGFMSEPWLGWSGNKDLSFLQSLWLLVTEDS